MDELLDGRFRTRCEGPHLWGRSNRADGENILRRDVARDVQIKGCPFIFFAEVGSLLSLAIDLVNQAHAGALLGDLKSNSSLCPTFHQGTEWEDFSVLWPCCIESCAKMVDLGDDSALAHFVHGSRGPFSLSFAAGCDAGGMALNAADEPTQAEVDFHFSANLLSESPIPETVPDEASVITDSAPNDVDVVVGSIEMAQNNVFVLREVDPVGKKQFHGHPFPVLLAEALAGGNGDRHVTEWPWDTASQGQGKGERI